MIGHRTTTWVLSLFHEMFSLKVSVVSECFTAHQIVNVISSALHVHHGCASFKKISYRKAGINRKYRRVVSLRQDEVYNFLEKVKIKPGTWSPACRNQSSIAIKASKSLNTDSSGCFSSRLNNTMQMEAMMNPGSSS